MQCKRLFGVFLFGFVIVARGAMAEVPRECIQAEQAAQSKRFQVAILYYDNCLNSAKISAKQKARYFQYRGTAYRYMGQFGNAFADLNTAIRLDPNNATIYVSRGLIWRAQRNLTSAIADFTLSLKIKADNPVALLNRGAVYELLGQMEKAKQDFQEALDVGARHRFALKKAAQYGLTVEKRQSAPRPEVSWNLPDGFKLEHQYKTSGKLISHYISATETRHNWSERLTVNVDMSGGRQAPQNEAVLDELLEEFQITCSHSDIRFVEFNDDHKPLEGGVTTRAAMVFCSDRLISRVAKGSSFKRNAFVFYKVMEVPKGVITFQYHWQDDEKSARLIESSGHLTKFVLPLMSNANVQMVDEQKDTQFVALK